jgi:hypothetical protein
MKKCEECGCVNQSDTTKDVIKLLEREVSGYFSIIDGYEPERITRLKSYIKKLNKTCSP